MNDRHTRGADSVFSDAPPEEEAAPEQTAEEPEPEPEAPEPSGESVKDRPSVLMYLPEDLKQELEIRYSELNARFQREHGRPLEKNRDFYPALIQAGLEEKDLTDVLDI